MKKIPTLFLRDDKFRVKDVVTPGCEWVLAGQGVATRKWDGMCCMIRGGKLYKRYELKRDRTAPPGFEPAQEPDATGNIPGWLEVGDGPEDRWFREAFVLAHAGYSAGPGQSSFARFGIGDLAVEDGTYELCGPKINGNPDKFGHHVLVRHGDLQLLDVPRNFGELREWFTGQDIEGLVWHHLDGRMAKLKKKDFGLKREDSSVYGTKEADP